ncbi:hypothetical protein CSAL01_02006 [Colletotrichum salicis]|uniref:Major facilitator superfamily (MFS) profile domain-containing protein n=1 Tax=Colletotrichum salicis TaxID=1209931 RepID=A0A135TCM0_9PEZI|nr:hypothetical protein CSAL01_02006 [Colletotrichum salicis]
MGDKTASLEPSLTSGENHIGETSTTFPSWVRYEPGPSPEYRFKGLSPWMSRTGVVACGCFIFFISGFNLALMGSVSSLSSYLKVVGLEDRSKHSQLLIGLINAVYWIGVIIGALLVGSFSDKVGRHCAILFTGIFALIVVPFFAALQNFAWALACRFINGLVTGSFDSVGLNYSAETVDHRHRGRAIGFQLCCAATGAGIAYFIPFGLAKQTSSEVVWWLVKVGFGEAARDVTEAVKHVDDPMDLQSAVEAELESISRTIDMEREHNSSTSYWSMFTVRDELSTARRTWSAVFIQFATQAMIGAGFVSGYGIKIFETGGWSSELAALLSGMGILTQAAFGVPGGLLSDKIGRRNAMIGGAAGGVVVLALIGMCGYFVDKYAESDPELATSYGSATVALVFIWAAIFGSTWLGYGALFMICGLSFLVAFICYMWMPETAGKTLEEIDGLFH